MLGVRQVIQWDFLNSTEKWKCGHQNMPEDTGSILLCTMIRAIGCSWPYNTSCQEITYRSFLKISSEPRKQQQNPPKSYSFPLYQQEPTWGAADTRASLPLFSYPQPNSSTEELQSAQVKQSWKGTISAFIHLSFSTNLHETVFICPHYLHTKVYQKTETNICVH